MTQRLMATAALTLALLLAGCGDDGASPFGPGGAGSPGNADSNDIENSVGDLLEGLADGSVDSGDLGDLMENAENLAESFGDSGSGTVSINGETIQFSSEVCFIGQGDFTIDGAGTTSDGTPVWVSISQNVDSRAELAEYFEASMLDTLYGDADPIIGNDFSVTYGRTELFGGGPDDMPDFNASSGTLSQNDMEMNVSGQSASGSGSATDFNYVAGDFEARFDFTFSASCG